MALVTPHPALANEVSSYPSYAQALAYQKDKLRRGRRSYFHTKRLAKYHHSTSLDVIVIRLEPGLFEVRAYPVDGFVVATLEQALAAVNYRAWLFAVNNQTGKIYYLTGSQVKGIEYYRGFKRTIRQKRQPAKASHH